jgi:hypothetical protein
LARGGEFRPVLRSSVSNPLANSGLLLVSVGPKLTSTDYDALGAGGGLH